MLGLQAVYRSKGLVNKQTDISATSRPKPAMLPSWQIRSYRFSLRLKQSGCFDVRPNPVPNDYAMSSFEKLSPWRINTGLTL